MARKSMQDGIKDLAFPLHGMLGVSETAELQVETIPGPTTAVTLQVSIADNPGPGFFVKTLRKGANSGPHLNLGLREVRFYEFIDSLAIKPYPGIPRCINRFIAEDENQYFLVLEDLSESHQDYRAVDFTKLANWKVPLRSLAKFHQHFTQKLTRDQIHSYADGPQDVERYITKLNLAFQQFKAGNQEFVQESTLALMEQSIPLIRAFELEKDSRVFRNELTTILNRDAHLKNFLYPRSPDQEAVIVDWQFWGLGIGTFDLRHLLGSALNQDLRPYQQELVYYYYNIYQQGLAVEYSWEVCWDDYRKGMIDNLFMPVWQYTGFGWDYQRWGAALDSAVENYDALDCDQIAI